LFEDDAPHAGTTLFMLVEGIAPEPGTEYPPAKLMRSSSSSREDHLELFIHSPLVVL
jgi:hypothetical protein